MGILTCINATIFLILMSNVLNLTFELIATCGSQSNNITCQLLDEEVSHDQTLALDYRWFSYPSRNPKCFSVHNLYQWYRVSGVPVSICNEEIGLWSSIQHLYCYFWSDKVSVKIVLSHKSKIKWFNNSNCGMYYYLAFVLMSLLMYIVVLIITNKCYRYRRRDEDIHNKQMFAENYYKKYLPRLS